MEPEKGRSPSSLGRLVGRLSTFGGWFVHHPRQATRWLVAAARASRWLFVAACFQLAGAIFQRASVGVMQPLTTGHQMAAVQSTALISLFATMFFIVLFGVAGGKLNQTSIRKARPNTEKRDKWFDHLLRKTKKVPRIYTSLSSFVEMERKHRWALTLLPFLAATVLGTLLAQVYVARLPFSSGNAITALGGTAMAMKLAREEGHKGLALFLPLLSVAGASMMMPWGHHMDPVGLLAAAGGAVCNAVLVSRGKDMAHAGISVKAAGIAMAIGLFLGMAWLPGVHWSWEVLACGTIAGLLTVAGVVFYYVAQARLRLTKRVASALTVTGPALGALVGLLVLHQTLGRWSLAGIGVVLVASLLNAALTGTEEQNAAEKAKYTHQY